MLSERGVHLIVSFSIKPFGEFRPAVFEVLPAINGTPLDELIWAFEAEQHFDPLGGYRGLIPQHFDYGPLDRYFMGQFDKDSCWARLDGIYALGCECGEVGCWPLQCKVEVEGNTVVWRLFKQPHRPDRDYSRFGPFLFNADQYRAAVAALAAELSAHLSTPSAF
jgi:hypothetical protein